MTTKQEVRFARLIWAMAALLAPRYSSGLSEGQVAAIAGHMSMEPEELEELWSDVVKVREKAKGTA